MTKKELTPKQEKFCLLVAEGKTYSDAYRGSYNAENMSDIVINNKASELMKKGDITVRVQGLREKTTDKYVVTKESIAQKLEVAYQMGLKEKQTGASVSAQSVIAKMYGHMTDKVEMDITGDIKIKLPDGD